jgi:hypothetical protein
VGTFSTHKWAGDGDGDWHISAVEFDELLSRSVVVINPASSCFAAEMIEAHPEAKAVLNVRRDVDKWNKSAVTNMFGVEKNRLF